MLKRDKVMSKWSWIYICLLLAVIPTVYGNKKAIIGISKKVNSLDILRSRDFNDNDKVMMNGMVVKDIGKNFYEFQDNLGTVIIYAQESNQLLYFSMEGKKSIVLYGTIDRSSPPNKLIVDDIQKN
ncbi:MAG: NirD/YgiW/YdeI family stress tolerance protein [Shewanellaceae bacterium]|nr:NirD/YgiW/YdeI family stress tolerance protein [Shewanellaceae bacterium]